MEHLQKQGAELDTKQETLQLPSGSAPALFAGEEEPKFKSQLSHPEQQKSQR